MTKQLGEEKGWEGVDATTALMRILAAHPEIARIRLFEPSATSPVQERIAIPAEEEAMLRQALELRDSLGLPFWEAILLSARSLDPVPTEFLRAAAYHNPANENLQVLETEGLTEYQVRELTKRVTPGRMLAVSSAVDLKDGSLRHIPMLDFGALRPPSHLQLVKEVVTQLGMGGLVLVSGRSFHFYGEPLVSQTGLVNFLAKALLFTPLVDVRWVAHQLLEAACALRISAIEASDCPPYVVSRVTVNVAISEDQSPSGKEPGSGLR